jgi:dihydropyrimidinase
MASTTLIRNGTLVLSEGERAGDVRLEGERIAAVGPDLAAEGADRVVDASGCIVLPGIIDPHTHIQLDTGIYKTPDNWEIGTRTAACGGITTVIDFATQFPGQDMRTALAARQAEIGDLAQIDYGLHMMLTALPEEDAALDGWMAGLLNLGLNSAKVYTTYRPNYYQDDDALLRVLAAAGRYGIVVMVHCENDALVSAATARLVKAGQTGLAHHGAARPALAEVEAAHRVLFLAEHVTPRPAVYVVHCSASGTVDQVTLSQQRGQPSIAETTVQYLLLDESVYSGDHPERGIMQPPLRASDEKRLLWERLGSGAIATIGTDHCDYTIDQKTATLQFNQTPGGIPGLETLLPLLATYGVAAGRLTWPRLAEIASANPAAIFGLKSKGRLAVGKDADVVVYDPRPTSTVRAENLHGLAGYTPYEGLSVQGAVRNVFVRGRQLVRDGQFSPAPGWGRFVRYDATDRNG